MERKERNENAEPDQEHQEDVALGLSGDGRGRLLQCSEIKTARGLRHAAIKHDQTKQKNETSGRQIDRNFPCRGLPVAGPPDPDEQERGNQREFVKGVEEKEIERSECARGAASNEKEAGIEGVFALRDFAGEGNGRERYDRGEEHHHQAQAIDAETKVDPPLAADGIGGGELKTGLARLEGEIRERCRREDKASGPERRAPGRGANQNRERGHNGAEDDEK